jgi:uncharacterized small protein (DUF1192 family)
LLTITKVRRNPEKRSRFALIQLEFAATLEIFMRWVPIALLLMCLTPLAAQSLGDVARTQRDDPSRPRAKRVITNSDLSPIDQTPPALPNPTSKPNAKPMDRSQHADAERAGQQQHRITELSQRVQLLQNEVSDLERQRSSVRSSSVYGDPNRVRKNDEIKSLGDQIESKNRELAAARNELTEALERANKTTVLK